MAGYKETPRQKMIGMIYLVLTALLALNVSKDIIEAFVVVNESLVVTNQNFEKKININYDKFKQQNDQSPNKVGPWYNKALEVKKSATELVDYMRLLQAQLLAKVEGIEETDAKKLTLREVKKKDNYDIPTNFFIGNSQDGSAGEARKLKNKISEFKKKMMDALVIKDVNGKITDLRKNVIRERTLEDGKKIIDTLGLYTGDVDNKIEGHQPWEMKNFYHLITAGVITNLNRMITEVKNAEFDVINNLYQGISAEDFKFDNISAKVVPKSNYVLLGSEYEADIFVAAYDSKQTPEVIVWEGVDTITGITGEGSKVEGINGVCKYKINASGIGEKKYGGIIKITAPSGEPKTYWFKSEYVVGQPSATVSADKMNVFYVGVENPVTISVPGVANENVHASMTAGTLTPKGGGKYIVTVAAGPPNTTVNVSATIGGRITPMGNSLFRIKKVPNPVPKIGGFSTGVVSKSVLQAAKTIVPVMENFDFELFFKVVSFTMTMNITGDLIEENAVGNTLTPTMITKIKNAKAGTKIYLENIKAYGAGETRLLPLINLKLTN